MAFAYLGLGCGTGAPAVNLDDVPLHEPDARFDLSARFGVTRHHTYPVDRVSAEADFTHGDDVLPAWLGPGDKVLVNGVELKPEVSAGPRGNFYREYIEIASSYRFEIVYQGKKVVRELEAQTPEVACQNGPLNQNGDFAADELALGQPFKGGSLYYQFECAP